MAQMLKKLLTVGFVALLTACATRIDYPYYHYRGYVGPGEIEYHYSNHY